MRKPFTFDKKSDNRVCISCGDPLKENVVERKPTANMCFGDYRKQQILRGHFMATGKEVRQGKLQGRKKGRYM